MSKSKHAELSANNVAVGISLLAEGLYKFHVAVLRIKIIMKFNTVARVKGADLFKNTYRLAVHSLYSFDNTTLPLENLHTLCDWHPLKTANGNI